MTQIATGSAWAFVELLLTLLILFYLFRDRREALETLRSLVPLSKPETDKVFTRVFVIALIDNLLYPILVGKRLRLHTVPVFFAIVGGLAIFGAAALVLGPVILALTDAILEIWRRRTAHGRPAEEGATSGDPQRTQSESARAS